MTLAQLEELRREQCNLVTQAILDAKISVAVEGLIRHSALVLRMASIDPKCVIPGELECAIMVLREPGMAQTMIINTINEYEP